MPAYIVFEWGDFYLDLRNWNAIIAWNALMFSETCSATQKFF